MNPITRLPSGADFKTYAIPVGGTDTVYTVPVPLGEPEAMGLEFTVTSSGTVSVEVTVEQGNEAPTNYNGADDNYVEAENSSSPLITLTSAKKYIVGFSPVPSKYFRLKLTGTGSNDSSTTVEAKYCVVR